MSMITLSATSVPDLIAKSISAPNKVRSAICFRHKSPVDNCFQPSFSTHKYESVPFPDPGAPKKIKICLLLLLKLNVPLAVSTYLMTKNLHNCVQLNTSPSELLYP